MKFALLARKDDSMELLAFGSIESAEGFVEFVATYQRESGAGNGYGAYWIFDDKVIEVDPTDKRLVRSLEYDRILTMARDIAKARSGGRGVITMPAITYGTEDGAIVFQVWGFDLGSTPGPGDMYRVIKPELLPAGACSREGRVVEIVGDSARVLDCLKDGKSEEPPADDDLLTIPLKALMKIPDWLNAPDK